MALAFVQLTVALTSLPHYAYAQCAPDAGEGMSEPADPNAAAGTADDGQSEFSDLVGSGNKGGDEGGDSNDGGGEPANVAGTDGNGVEQAAQSSDIDVGSDSPSGAASGGLGGSLSLSLAGALGSGLAVNIDFRGGLVTTGGGGTAKTGLMEMMGDPIDLKMADKLHVQVDYVSAGAAAVRMARVCHSNAAVNTARVTVPMGTGWHMVYDRSLQVLSTTQVRLHRANGRTLDMNWNGNAWVSAMPAGVLSPNSGGWQYINHRDAIETYDATGRLLTITKAGLVVSLQYDTAGRLARAVNPFGRALSFGYDGSNRVASVTLPDGNTLGYAYDTRNNLSSIRFADNSTRVYAYESVSFPNALTGVVDESGRRRLTWGYDAQGRPNVSYYGAGSNAVTAVYNGNQVTTTDARGTQRVRTFANIGARRVMTSILTAATVDSAANAWTFTYDGNGNPLSVTTRGGEVQQFGIDARGRTLTLTRAAGTQQALPSNRNGTRRFARSPRSFPAVSRAISALMQPAAPRWSRKQQPAQAALRHNASTTLRIFFNRSRMHAVRRPLLAMTRPAISRPRPTRSERSATFKATTPMDRPCAFSVPTARSRRGRSTRVDGSFRQPTPD